MPLDLPVTSIAALLNGTLFLILTIRVITYRRRQGVVYGDNSDKALMKRIRGQANAAEQMPIALILMALCELQGAPLWPLVWTAILLTVGRVLHGVYFTREGMNWRLRFYGMFLTLLAQGGLLLLLLGSMIS